MKNITNTLREHSLKVTQQRIAIYNYLLNSREHPIAEKIYGALCDEYPTMSLSTVYKTLEVFKEKKLVLELNAGEDSFRYDANTTPHDHFYCLRCKSLIDIEDNGEGERQEAIAKHDKRHNLPDYEVFYERSYLYGHCPACS